MPLPHNRSCTATRRDGQPCTGTAMRGQDRCRQHGGMSPHALAGADRRLAEQKVRAELAKYAVPVDGDAFTVLLQMLSMAAGAVAYLTAEIQRRQQIAIDAEQPGAMVLTQEGTHSTEIAAMVRLHGEQMDRAARYAKMALDAGVDERMVRLAEEQGRLVASVLEATLVELGLSDEKITEGREIMARQLLALDEGGP